MKTVADLIAELQKLDPTLQVLVDGYEGGYIHPVLSQKNMVEVGHRAYMGPFEESDNAYWAIEDGATPFNAIVLSRLGPD